MIKFLLDIRHRPIEDVVFDKVKLVKPLGSSMLKAARHVDAPAASIAPENVHALEGLACHKRVAPASSPAAPASRVRRSRSLRSTLAAAPGRLAHALVTKQ